MKLLFFSDVHGVPSTLERLFEHADALQPDLMVLLGYAFCWAFAFDESIHFIEKRLNSKAPLAVR